MAQWHLPVEVASWISQMASLLHARLAWRLLPLLAGALFAQGRKTVASWLRGGRTRATTSRTIITSWAASDAMSKVLRPCCCGSPCASSIPDERVLLALDDTATKRYGPQVEGAGIHHNATPGPADQQFMYGHVWVTLSWVVRHAFVGHDWFAAVGHAVRAAKGSEEDRAVVQGQVSDQAPAGSGAGRMGGANAAQPGQNAVGRGRRRLCQATVFAACPEGGRGGGQPAAQGRGLVERAGTCASRGRRKRAGHASTARRPSAWPSGPAIATAGSTATSCCTARQVRKKYKTFLATYKPAGGLIRVVLVKERTIGLPTFAPRPTPAVQEILEAVADRSAIEQNFHDSRKCTERASSNCATTGPTSPPTM